MAWLPNSTYNVILINKTNLIFKLKTWEILCYCIFLHRYLYNYQILLIESCYGYTYYVKLFIYKENNLCSPLQLQLIFLFDFLAPPRYLFQCRYPSYYPIMNTTKTTNSHQINSNPIHGLFWIYTTTFMTNL